MTAPGLSPIERAIKLADRDLIDAAGKTVAVSAHFGVSPQLVGRWNNLNDELFISAERRVDLEDATRGVPGHPHFTRAMAKRQGFALVKLPDGETPTSDNLLAAIADQARAANAVTSGMLDALADQLVTAAEARREMDNCFLAAERAMRLHALLSQIAEVG